MNVKFGTFFILLFVSIHGQSLYVSDFPSPSLDPTLESDVLQITGVIILIVVGCCLITLHFLLLILYLFLLYMRYNRRRRTRQRQEKYLKGTHAINKDEIEYERFAEEIVELPQHNEGLSKTFSHDSSHVNVTTFHQQSIAVNEQYNEIENDKSENGENESNSSEEAGESGSDRSENKSEDSNSDDDSD